MTDSKQILITGGTGFIGSHLSQYLVAQGYLVTMLSRTLNVKRNPSQGITVTTSLATLNNDDWYGIINLAGEPLNRSRWSAAQKNRIIDSRISVTRTLNSWIRTLKVPPKVYISGSAIGYYGHWDNELIDEDSLCREGFSNLLCKSWEAAANEVADLPIRRCVIRIGIVLGNDGGSLPALLLPAKLGLGGPMGGGSQWWSWIHVQDLVRSCKLLLEDPEAQGAFNLTAPNPVTQAEFARILGKQLNRPAIMPLPAFMMKLLVGEFADEVLLRGQRVLPSHLLKRRFTFAYPNLALALSELL